MEELLALLGIGSGGLLTGAAYQGLGDVGDIGLDEGRQIGMDAADMSKFKGFGVTGPTGSSTVDADGNVGLNLSPGQSNFADKNRQASVGMLGSATADTGAREADMYERIRATQRPEEQRAMLDMESRMAAQGRTGVSTAAYGGTPEQLAYYKAVEEAKNSASLGAIGEARAQQAQDAELSSLFGKMQYMPEANLRDNMGVGNQTYGFVDASNRQGAGLFAESATSGLDALLASRLGQANLMGNLGASALTGGFGMLSAAMQNNTGGESLVDRILGGFL